MAMFFCARCEGLSDSDDGCEEAPGYRLYCVECADEMADQRERPRSTPLPSRTQEDTNGYRD